MTVLNEEAHLAECVAEVLSQDYPGEMEFILALGPSRDRTDKIAYKLAAADPRVRIVPNPAGVTPTGLNEAIRTAKHDIIARVDGHGILSPGYLRRSVELLEDTGAANVGGLMVAVGRTGFEEAVAKAYGSRIGLGGGTFHVGGPEGPADTVYLGVFRREALEAVGCYDEAYHRAQDWELNLRIRQAGHTVWFSPELRVYYRPRSSLKELARQFFRTGQWRREVMRQYPETVQARYLAPPVATTAIGLGVVAGTAAVVPAVDDWLHLGWLAPATYAGVAVGAAVVGGRSMSWRARAWLPVVLGTIHLCWGTGFLTGLAAGKRKRVAQERARQLTLSS